LSIDDFSFSVIFFSNNNAYTVTSGLFCLMIYVMYGLNFS
jgi:hypothetical protein